MQLLLIFSVKPHYAPGYGLDIKPPTSMSNEVQPAWQGRSIAGPKIRLVEFSAFLEQQRDADSVSHIKSRNCSCFFSMLNLEVLITTAADDILILRGVSNFARCLKG